MGDNPVGKKVNTPGKYLGILNTLVFTFLRKYPSCLMVNTFLLRLCDIRFLLEPCRQKTKKTNPAKTIMTVGLLAEK